MRYLLEKEMERECPLRNLYCPVPMKNCNVVMQHFLERCYSQFPNKMTRFHLCLIAGESGQSLFP